MKRLHRLSILITSALTATLLPLASGAAADDASGLVTIADPAAACADLAGATISAKQIDLNSKGAAVQSATLTPADSATGRPEHCTVTAHISPVDTQAPDINVAINLPTEWNSRSMHFGGGGFNGVVVDGLGSVPGSGGGDSPVSPITPINRGYVTFGSDSGSAVGTDPAGSFGLNDEALQNYAGDAVKKTRDTAMAIVKAYYDQLPAQQFFAGGSKGGHEALVAAQRYGDDYDGIIAYYPANQNPALPISWHDILQHWNSPGGALNDAEQALLYNSVMGVCDGLDGVSDGVIANVSGCNSAFSVEILRCPDTTDMGDWCLSAAQIKTIQSAATPFLFDYKLANGVTSIGAYPVLQGAGLDSETIAGYDYFTGGTWPYMVTRDPDLDPATFDYLDWKSRIKKLSKMYDAVDPNIDKFHKDGGKLLIVQGTTDNLVTPAMTSWYVDRLDERYGDELPSFARYYLQPGYSHGGGAFNLSWDSLSALESWVLNGSAPLDPVATDANPATLGRQMPLCAYPTWPQYTGGDSTLATSYTCTTGP